MNHYGGRTDHVHRPFYVPFQTATASLERGDYSKPEGAATRVELGASQKLDRFSSGPVCSADRGTRAAPWR